MPEAEPEVEPEAEVEAEPEVEPEAEAEAEAEAEVEPEPEAEAEAEVEPEAEAEAEAEVEPEAEAEVEAEVEPEAEAEPEPEAEVASTSSGRRLVERFRSAKASLASSLSSSGLLQSAAALSAGRVLVESATGLTDGRLLQSTSPASSPPPPPTLQSMYDTFGAGPEPDAEPGATVTAFTDINRGWATVLHMWFLQLSCLFLWNMFYHACERMRPTLHASRGKHTCPPTRHGALCHSFSHSHTPSYTPGRMCQSSTSRLSCTTRSAVGSSICHTSRRCTRCASSRCG